jgi:predicted hydrolase (HD superfamily)
MSDGPFTDDMIRHYVKVVQTQHGIAHVAEEMAKVLAEMGRASGQAVGDAPAYAVQRWSDLIRKRALELVRQEKKVKTCELPSLQKKLPSPGI